MVVLIGACAHLNAQQPQEDAKRFREDTRVIHSWEGEAAGDGKAAKKKKGSGGKPKLKVSCAGSDTFLTIQLEVKKGKKLKKALGKKLKVKVKTPKTLIFPPGTKITAQVTTG